MRKLIPIACLVMGIAASCWCQSAEELGAKYQAVRTYEVRPGILMTPLFASDGQVCEMVVEQHAIISSARTVIDFNSPLSDKALHTLIDQLVPRSQRGERLKDINHWIGSVIVDGPFVVTKYEYENVTVEVNEMKMTGPKQGHAVIIIKWRHRTCATPRKLAPTASVP